MPSLKLKPSLQQLHIAPTTQTGRQPDIRIPRTSHAPVIRPADARSEEHAVDRGPVKLAAVHLRGEHRLFGG